MQVKAEQVLSQLSKNSLPIVWVAGDESLLVQECCDQIRQYAKEKGYLTREVLDVAPQFDWQSLLESSNSMSLFADKKLIDLRFNNAKFDNNAKKNLQAYADNPSEDNLLLITSAKIEKASTKAKWFQSIEKHAYFVQIWPINAQQLPLWIERRLKQHGLTADQQAIELLVHRVEGNLLAAAQEIEKLMMLTQESHLDVAVIAQAVADSSRYSVFNLIDSILSGHAARALRILNHLKAEGTEPLQILNLLCREIRNLSTMRTKVEAGQYPNAVMQAARVWSNRTKIIGTALNNHSVADLEQMLSQAKDIDQGVKGLLPSNPWDQLTHLCLTLANTSTCISTINKN